MSTNDYNQPDIMGCIPAWSKYVLRICTYYYLVQFIEQKTKIGKMRVGLAYRGFRTKFIIISEREIHFIKVDEVCEHLQLLCMILTFT